MTHYIVQIIVFQALFLGIYELFLKKETFFSLNRVYLLITPFLAAIIPLLEFGVLQNFVPLKGMIQLPALVLSEGSSLQGASTAIDLTLMESMVYFLKINRLLFIYLLGALVSFVLFLRKYMQLQHLKSSGKLEKRGTINIVSIPKSRMACTFFNTVFLGEDLSEEETAQILSHELAHVEQKHSWDLLLFEMLRILLWFDPFIYRHQSQLSVLHEYIADEKVTRNLEKTTYFQNLLNTTFNTRKISFTNQFFNHSLIKKRIMMLQKPKSNRNAKLRYLLILPLLFTMLIYVSCSKNEPQKEPIGITHDTIIDGEKIKTFEVGSFELINEEKEAKIVEFIQQIGTRYDKVLVTDGEQSLIFDSPSWAEGFIDQSGYFHANRLKIFIKSTPPLSAPPIIEKMRFEIVKNDPGKSVKT